MRTEVHGETLWRSTMPDVDSIFELLERPAWHAEAACRGRDDLDFFPDRPHDIGDRIRAVCAGCPVRDDCRTAGQGERFGWWGGESPRERRRRSGAAGRACEPEHGTAARYRARCRCGACREWKARSRGRAA